MKAFVFRFLSVLFSFSVLLAAASQQAAIPLEHFAKLPVFSDPKISPDGKRIAFRLVKDGKNLLIVQPIPKNGETLDETFRSIGIGDKYFNDFDWANDTRLIVNIRTAVAGKKQGGYYGRLIAVDVRPDGPAPVDLASRLRRRNKDSFHIAESTHWPRVVNRLKYDNENVLAILEYVFEGTNSSSNTLFLVPDFHLVNIYNGKSKRKERNPKLLRWVIGDENDQIRAGFFRQWMYKRDFSRVKLFYRESEADSWDQLHRVEYLDHKNLTPLRFDYEDENILLVSVREHGSDYDLVDETRYPIFRYDLTKRKILGEFKNEKQVSVKAMLKKSMPELEHRIVSFDDEKTSYIVRSYAVDKASTYFLVDLKSRSLVRLGREYPALERRRLAERKEFEYVARDGRRLKAFVTLPAQAVERLPMVVFPHSGLFSHDEEGFDNYAHFLASRGYAVVQPQFRGSTGYGVEYEEAGYGEWARKMQYDITDAARWMVEKGMADETNICILGAGFGGYSAAWAAANESDLYRCAISINGVLNTVKLVEKRGWQLEDPLGRKVFADRDHVRNKSPHQNSEKIAIPLLLIAAKGDAVVPIEHSAKLYKKMKKNKQSVKFVKLEGGEHWQTNEKNEITTFQEVEKFLAQHLK